MAKITLDDIRESAERKYGDLEIELPDGNVVTLLNALRLPKERRKRLEGLESDASVSSENAEEQFMETIRAIAKTSAQAEQLIEALGNDLTQYASILEMYSKETEAGEA